MKRSFILLLFLSGILFSAFSQETPVPGKEKPKNVSPLRVALNVGFSHNPSRIAEGIDPSLHSYMEKLKSGYHFGGDAAYYINRYFGVGAKVTFFKTSNSMSGLQFTDNEGNTRTGMLRDKITVMMAGPTFTTRFLNASEKNALILNITPGIMTYKNNITLIDPYVLTGKTFGIAIDAGYDFGITDNLCIGVQLSFIAGALKKVSVKGTGLPDLLTLPSDQKESLFRFDFTIGLRFKND